MEPRDQLSEANAQHIKGELKNLKINHFSEGIFDYQAFWTHSRQVSDLFKSLKPLQYDTREELWEEFSRICDEVKSRQKQEKDEAVAVSAHKKKLILDKIDEAMTLIQGAKSSAGVANAQAMINETMRWMKCDVQGIPEKTSLFKTISAKLTFDDNNICWAHWKDAHDLIQNRRLEMGDENHHLFFEKAIQTLKMANESDPFQAKEMVRDIQSDLKSAIMSSAQFQEIRDVLDQAWKTAIKRQEEKKKEQIVKGLDHVERWETTITKNEELLDRLTTQIEECKVMEKDATSYEFAAKVRGWIEEKMEKMNSIKTTNIELLEKIHRARQEAQDAASSAETQEED